MRLAAVRQLEKKEYAVLVGLQDGKVGTTRLDEVISNKKLLDLKLLEMARVLAR